MKKIWQHFPLYFAQPTSGSGQKGMAALLFVGGGIVT
jgi:hypothetical protein